MRPGRTCLSLPFGALWAWRAFLSFASLRAWSLLRPYLLGVPAGLEGLPLPSRPVALLRLSRPVVLAVRVGLGPPALPEAPVALECLDPLWRP